MTQKPLPTNSGKVWAEKSPLGKGWHALPYLRKACFGIALRMTQKALT